MLQSLRLTFQSSIMVLKVQAAPSVNDVALCSMAFISPTFLRSWSCVKAPGICAWGLACASRHLRHKASVWTLMKTVGWSFGWGG